MSKSTSNTTVSEVVEILALIDSIGAPELLQLLKAAAAKTVTAPAKTSAAAGKTAAGKTSAAAKNRPAEDDEDEGNEGEGEGDEGEGEGEDEGGEDEEDAPPPPRKLPGNAKPVAPKKPACPYKVGDVIELHDEESGEWGFKSTITAIKGTTLTVQLADDPDGDPVEVTCAKDFSDVRPAAAKKPVGKKK